MQNAPRVGARLHFIGAAPLSNFENSSRTKFANQLQPVDRPKQIGKRKSNA
jgi:hypothetical protein